MDEKQAVRAFSALAQEGRLRVVRLLVKAGPSGLSASTIADAVRGTPSTMSFHFRQLEHAGLISSRREGRWIFYSADYDALDALNRFLLEECCSGHPELCFPLLTPAGPTEPAALPALKKVGNTRERSTGQSTARKKVRSTRSAV